MTNLQTISKEKNGAMLQLAYSSSCGKFSFFFTAVTKDICYFTKIDRSTGEVIERIQSW